MKTSKDCTNTNYLNYVKGISPKTKQRRSLLRAFGVGGVICSIGQTIRYLLQLAFGLSGDELSSYVSMILILIGGFLTGLGIYDRIGKFAGGGSIVPITGFANSLTASALESKSEGIITGILTNMFKLAGAVIATAIISAFIIGSIIYFVRV